MDKKNDVFPSAHFFAQMMSIPQSIRAVRERCRFLEQSYPQRQEALLRETDQAFPVLYGQVSAYDVAAWSIQRLTDTARAVRRYEEDRSQQAQQTALCLLIESLTKEIAALGYGYSSADEERFDNDATPQYPDLTRYRQAQKAVLTTVLQELEVLVAPLLINLVIGSMGAEWVHALDSEPYRSEYQRREAVAAACQQLADENKLESTYAAIAHGLATISFPRDIHSEEDRYRRHAMPIHVNRLLVADLLAFIAMIKVEWFAAASATDIALVGCSSAAHALVARRGNVCPQPQQTMWVDVLHPSQPRLKQAGIVASHQEPCPFCRTHCTIRRVTFPEGTDFGEAIQQEPYQQREHSYSFSPRVPAPLPDSFILSLDYSGVWEPDHPWTLLLLDVNEDITSSKEQPTE